jgi:hypothetical protein
MNCLCCFESIVYGPLIGKFCCLAYDWVVQHVAAIVEGISQLTEAHFGSYIPLILYAFNRIELGWRLLDVYVVPMKTWWLHIFFGSLSLRMYFLLVYLWLWRLKTSLGSLIYSLLPCLYRLHLIDFGLTSWSYDVLFYLEQPIGIVASLSSHRPWYLVIFLVDLLVLWCANYL